MIVSDAIRIDGWRLERAADDDIDELMTWFDSKRSVEIWGGPKFRYPFNKESFVEDSHWYDMATFSLRSPDSDFSGFGQVYERNKRINLARLIAHPQMRGQGIGKRLTQELMFAGENIFPLDEYSLFVYRDNTPALECYRSLGFEIQDYPSDQFLAHECYYLTRLVAGRI